MAPIRSGKSRIPKKCPHCEWKRAVDEEEGDRRCRVCTNHLTRTTALILSSEASAEARFVLADVFHGPCKLKDRFVDTNFLPGRQSVRGTSKIRLQKSVTTWKRLQFFLPKDVMDVKSCVLYKHASIGDVKQGHLQNCALMAALCALAGQPKLLGGIFTNDSVKSSGGYKVNLYTKDQGSSGWKLTPTFLDDMVPSSEDKPTFAGVKGTQIWAPLLEKGIAKLRGSYMALDMISCEDSFGHLIGKNSVSIPLQANGETEESLWGRLKERNQNLLIALSTSKLCQFTRNHAFTVLGLYEVGNVKLLKIRNPHGRASAPLVNTLSPDDRLWSKLEPFGRLFRTSKQEYEDGIYWMLFDKFLECFRRVVACDPNA